MVQLMDKETGKVLGEITDEEMIFLVESLEEEAESDEDYYFDPDTIEYLKEKGLAPHLESMLSAAVAGKEGIEIIFKK